MRPFMILRAHCEELGEAVTINTARREFLSWDPPIEKFHFFCSDPKCLALRVKVAGVNYRTAAEDSIKRLIPHFRAVDPTAHDDECQWRIADAEREQPTPLDGEGEDEFNQRLLRRKLSDFVTAFDPRGCDDNGTVHAAPSSGDPQAEEERADTNTTDGKKLSTLRGSESLTRDLERLVETFREMRQVLPPAKMPSVTLRVVGLGRISILQYFRTIKKCDLSTSGIVVSGGAVFDKWYGAGFRFRFLDRINDLPVFLYVGDDLLVKYRSRKYITGLVQTAERDGGARIYAIGHFEASPAGKSINLIIDSLNHLAIFRSPKEK